MGQSGNRHRELDQPLVVTESGESKRGCAHEAAVARAPVRMGLEVGTCTHSYVAGILRTGENRTGLITYVNRPRAVPLRETARRL